MLQFESLFSFCFFFLHYSIALMLLILMMGMLLFRESLLASRVERILGTTTYRSHGRKKIIRRSVSLQDPSTALPEQTQTESTERKSFTLSDRFTTLEEALRVLPIELGFVVEIKYPADWAKRTYNIVYHERNPLVDRILDVSISYLML
jgi:hypothetical protein